jgi:hypothetical protein
MARTHDSERAAASRNPRARSIRVNPDVMGLVIVNSGWKWRAFMSGS